MVERGLLAVMVLVLVGCDERPPAVPTDTGPRPDVFVPSQDAGPLDAGEPMDADVDAGTPDMDAEVPDAGEPQDAGPLPMDASIDAFDPMTLDSGTAEVDGSFRDALFMDLDGGMESDAGIDCTNPLADPCACSAFPTCSTTSQCDEGQVCAPDPECGLERCTPAGHLCTNATDCPSGSECLARGPNNICVPTGATCNDSRDCPYGFSCDSGACVERRVACDELTDCPYGYVCDRPTLAGSFCRRFDVPCANDADCIAGVCRNVDGVPGDECVAGGSCATNTDCSVAGEVCGTAPMLNALCGPYGYCASGADCASGYECLDLWGDGPRHCVRTGGACSAASPCAMGSICAVVSPTAAPTCIHSAL